MSRRNARAYELGFTGGVLSRRPEPSYGSGSSELCMVEAPGVEPGSEDLQRNGSTCVADRFSFAATHAHRLA